MQCGVGDVGGFIWVVNVLWICVPANSRLCVVNPDTRYQEVPCNDHDLLVLNL